MTARRYPGSGTTPANPCRNPDLCASSQARPASGGADETVGAENYAGFQGEIVPIRGMILAPVRRRHVLLTEWPPARHCAMPWRKGPDALGF